MPSTPHISQLSREELDRFVEARALVLSEEEALAVLASRFCSSDVCLTIAQNQRLTSFYSVKLRLVAHRATPQAQSLKFVYHLYWRDLLRLSGNVTVPPAVRRAIEKQLAARLTELTVGERVTSAKVCSRELIRVIMFDEEPRVFRALLVNARLTEDDLVTLIASNRATAEQLTAIAGDRKWSLRRGIRKALVLNSTTPKAIAASQLRHLTRLELMELEENPAISQYLAVCIGRILRPTGGVAEG